MTHAGPHEASGTGTETPEPEQSQEHPTELVYELLHEVIDPEVGVNIVDLGLIYGVQVSAPVVQVRMTLTTPGCPLSGYMRDSIEQVLTGSLRGITATDVDIVWDPAWGPEMMTDEAKRQLGWIR
jgi:metal-sulfur cluster biosynthetic enzyme